MELKFKMWLEYNTEERNKIIYGCVSEDINFNIEKYKFLNFIEMINDSRNLYTLLLFSVKPYIGIKIDNFL